MALTFNSNNITTATWNGNSLTQINWNGTKVWPEVTPVEPNYFYILNDTGSTINWEFDEANAGQGYTPNLLISNDKTNWTSFIKNTQYTLTDGQKCYFKAGTGGNNGMASSSTDYLRFYHDGDSGVKIGGSLATLIDENGTTTDLTTTSACNFYGMFNNTIGTAFTKIDFDTTFEIPFTKVPHDCFNVFGRTAFDMYYFPDLSKLQKVGCWAFFNCFNQSIYHNITVDISGIDEFIIDGDGQGTQFQNFLSGNSEGSIAKIKLSSLYSTPQRAYRYMARYVPTISEVEVGWIMWPSSSNATQNWLQGSDVSVFKCPSALGTNQSIARSDSTCPATATVINTDI